MCSAARNAAKGTTNPCTVSRAGFFMCLRIHSVATPMTTPTTGPRIAL